MAAHNRGEADRAITVYSGQTLPHSARLAIDLTNGPSDGLVIGGDITEDLAGHTITERDPGHFAADVGYATPAMST